jgi:hypothetical protein
MPKPAKKAPMKTVPGGPKPETLKIEGTGKRL